MTCNPPLKCDCNIPWIVNGKCVRCKRPIHSTTEPKVSEYDLRVYGKSIPSPVEGEWENKILTASKSSDTTLSGKEVVYDPEYLIGWIHSLLHSERESAMLRQRNYDQTLIDKARAEERERIGKIIDEFEKNGWDLHELRAKITDKI